jgi:hypothetical protein
LLEELLEATAATAAAERATLLEKDGLAASAKAAAAEGRATLARLRVVGVVAGIEASSEFCPPKKIKDKRETYQSDRLRK